MSPFLWKVFRPFIEAHWSLQRRIDMRVLWPTCKQLAENMDEAKAAFAAHAFFDPAWIEYYGEAKLIEFINQME